MKTSELAGAALDWAVARCEGYTATFNPNDVVYTHPNGNWHHNGNWRPSSNWVQAGPIIEREQICIDAGDGSFKGNRVWSAHLARNAPVLADEEITGPTPLIAAMRAFVASKLGDEIEIPKELENLK